MYTVLKVSLSPEGIRPPPSSLYNRLLSSYNSLPSFYNNMLYGSKYRFKL